MRAESSAIGIPRIQHGKPCNILEILGVAGSHRQMMRQRDGGNLRIFG